MKFAGKVVGITGASKLTGIGFAIAKSFLQNGAKVFIGDIVEEPLRIAVEELAKFGEVKGYIVDVSNEASVISMFDNAEADFGKIDIFVSNAGIYPQSPVCDMSVEKWDAVMGINLRSVFLCAKECRKRMKEGGVLINAASFAALIGSCGSGAYAASKSAVHSLTKVLAAEFAPLGIRVNGYIPGVIATDMTQGLIDIKGDELTKAIPLHKLGKPQDVANAVLFLASDEASYLTGTFIEVTGGKLCVQNPDTPWQ